MRIVLSVQSQGILLMCETCNWEIGRQTCNRECEWLHAHLHTKDCRDEPDEGGDGAEEKRED